MTVFEQRWCDSLVKLVIEKSTALNEKIEEGISAFHEQEPEEQQKDIEDIDEYHRHWVPEGHSPWHESASVCANR